MNAVEVIVRLWMACIAVVRPLGVGCACVHFGLLWFALALLHWGDGGSVRSLHFEREEKGVGFFCGREWEDGWGWKVLTSTCLVLEYLCTWRIVCLCCCAFGCDPKRSAQHRIFDPNQFQFRFSSFLNGTDHRKLNVKIVFWSGLNSGN